MKAGKWFEALSPVTLTSAFASVTLGTALAWYSSGEINPFFYLATLIGLLSAQGGINLINDYVDYKARVDVLYKKSGFSHRKNAIIDLGLKPSNVRGMGYFMIIVALSLGIYLAVEVGIPIIILGAIGIFLGVIYSEPPLKLKYRGYGEIVAAIVMGPLVVWGSYVVQRGSIANLSPLLVGVINGSFVFLTLMGSSTLKSEVYKALNKKNIVLVLGNRIKYAVYTSIALIYVSLVVSSLFNYIPLISLISLILVPRTIRLARPLLSKEGVKNRWKELRSLWSGPFSVRIVILIIILVSMIISRWLWFLNVTVF
ncbi:MAG: prenyltransferase [Caldisphaeraceae archaeon]|nr:prenyltransferase [Caldisphaeraceae archaeon]MEB3691856.1 prenyltransferase [Caldisphaeraceae archaeon]MEB3798122.1 prenyltransferase [Caldisphaeraceae archaeon]